MHQLKRAELEHDDRIRRNLREFPDPWIPDIPAKHSLSTTGLDNLGDQGCGRRFAAGTCYRDDGF